MRRQRVLRIVLGAGVLADPCGSAELAFDWREESSHGFVLPEMYFANSSATLLNRVGAEGLMPMHAYSAESASELRRALARFRNSEQVLRNVRGRLHLQWDRYWYAEWHVGMWGSVDCTIAFASVPAFLHAAEGLLVAAGHAPLGPFLNVGANDGEDQDPLFDWLSQGRAAVAFEADPALCRRHRANLPRVALVCEPATPPAVRALVRPHLDPASIDVVKIDIDSYDCDVLSSLLQGDRESPEPVRPRFIVMEVNPIMAPPLRFNQRYDPDRRPPREWRWSTGPGNLPFHGCSLGHQVHLLAAYGYILVHHWHSDAVFASLRAAQAIGLREQNAYACYLRSLKTVRGVPMSALRRWAYEVPIEEARAETRAYLLGVQEDLRKQGSITSSGVAFDLEA